MERKNLTYPFDGKLKFRFMERRDIPMKLWSTISNKQTSEPRKRLKKLRSVKVASLDRSRLSLKQKKSGLSQKRILADEMSNQASPNYMKATSCSNAKRGSSQLKSGNVNAGDGSIEIRSAKHVKRIVSLKRSRKNSTTRSRLSCDNETTTPRLHLNAFHSNPGEFEYSFDTPHYLGRGAEANIQLVRSGSIKLNTRKSVKLSRRHWSKSRFNKALIFRTDDESPEEPSSVDAPGLKPVRALWKIPSLRHRRKTCFDIATCSSTINSSKFVDIDSGRYERNSQVCQYTYCSIHGSSPPLSLSSKKCSLKKQKSRRQKLKSKTEKVQTHEVTMEHQAILLDKQGCTNMWNLIYNHLLVHRNELNSEVCETAKDKQDPYTKEAVGENPEFSQVEAVEFVQQAVDEILLVDEVSSFHHPRGLNDVMQFPKPPRSKGFKKIRKLIATTKFIKAMEKLRKDTAADAPQNLFLEAHCGKETAGWMLDVALQQVITKLDPAQQRRVGMLIEAFESVTQDSNICCNPEPLLPDCAPSVQEPDVGVKCRATVATAHESVYVESRGRSDDGGTNRDLSRIPEEEMIIVKDANFHFDKAKFTNVWHQVYHRFIASEAIDLGNEKNDGVDEIKHGAESGHLNQASAIQLVQEAIDELIHLQEQLSEQLSSELHNVPEHDIVHNNAQATKSKAYSKLRKMVVSAKFIRAMEKLRKINPQKPQNVPLEAGSWMLDCALQEVITKLAPAQQKKVAMLTQAFETFSSDIQQVRHGTILRENNIPTL